MKSLPLTFLALTGLALVASPVQGETDIQLAPISTITTGIFDGSAAEIVAHDATTQRLFVTNVANGTVDVFDISDPANPQSLAPIDVTPYGDHANSVAAYRGVVAVAIEAFVKTDAGTVVFFDAATGNYVNQVTVGALPDMLTFTPNGRAVLVANEGEPNDDYTIDPEGSVSVIDMTDGPGGLTQDDVRTADFTAFNDTMLDPSVRIFGPNATVAQDLEPEYIAVSDDSKHAWVTLQENNAIGLLDVPSATFVRIVGLGFKDHSLPGNGIDASDKDDAINIANWPVFGMYQPDGIASFTVGGNTFLIMANEGDARDYDAFAEEVRVKDLVLDPDAFPNAAELQADEALGRLNVTSANGDIDNDGDYDQLYAFGGRSFSIRDTKGNLVFDSADAFEQITAAALPDFFNSNNDDNNSFDSRSDNKGPEPEGVAVGTIGRRTFGFIGLERIGGIMAFELTNPAAPRFVQYINNRDFSGDPVLGTAGDLGPEGIIFVKASQSPNGRPLVIVANEVSGSTTIYQIDPASL